MEKKEINYNILRNDILNILPDVDVDIYDEAETFVREGNPPNAYIARLCILAYLAGRLQPRE